MLILGYIDKYMLMFVSIALHELGHIITAILVGGRLHTLRLLAVGVNACIDSQVLDKRNKVLIYISGPLVNTLLFTLFTLVKSYYFDESGNMSFFILANISLAILNLLPILPLDGGKLLREILSNKVGMLTAGIYTRYATIATAILITAAGIFQIYISRYNFSLLMIGVYAFLCLNYEDRETAIMSVKDVIYRRTRILKKGVYPARDIVAVKWLQLGELIKCMDYDRFHIVHVVDENLKLLCTLTEQEIIDGMLKHSANITFEEFMKVKNS